MKRKKGQRGRAYVSASFDGAAYAEITPDTRGPVDEHLMFTNSRGKKRFERTAKYIAGKQASAVKRGGAKKHLAALQAVVNQLNAEHQGATAGQIWELLPELAHGDVEPGVYREGELDAGEDSRRVVLREEHEIKEARGYRNEIRERSIAYATFRSYVTRARQKKK